MRFFLGLLDSAMSYVLRSIIKLCLWIASLYVVLTYKFGKSKMDQKEKLINFGNQNDRLQKYFSTPYKEPTKNMSSIEPMTEHSEPIYSEEFDEIEEFEKIKKYLTKKAVEMGGTINWYQAPDGLIIYLYEFDNDKTYRAFEQIMKDVSLNGIKEEIDDDIEEMLSDIEDNLGK